MRGAAVMAPFFVIIGAGITIAVLHERRRRAEAASLPLPVRYGRDTLAHFQRIAATITRAGSTGVTAANAMRAFAEQAPRDPWPWPDRDRTYGPYPPGREPQLGRWQRPTDNLESEGS